MIFIYFNAFHDFYIFMCAWKPEMLDPAARDKFRDRLALKGGLHYGKLGRRRLSSFARGSHG